MAQTAAIAISPSTVYHGQACNVTMTYTNNDVAGGLNLLNVVPQAYPTGVTTEVNQNVASGLVPFGPNVATGVTGAGGTRSVSWQFTPYLPWYVTAPWGASSQVYVISCTVYTSDGAVLAATTTQNLTVKPLGG